MRKFPAYALSSSYNLPIGLGCGYDSIQAAIAGFEKADEGVYSELETDLIYALAARSSAESKAAMNPAEMNFGKVDTCVTVKYYVVPTAVMKASTGIIFLSLSAAPTVR